jgi:hypothetical protein
LIRVGYVPPTRSLPATWKNIHLMDFLHELWEEKTPELRLAFQAPGE